MSFGGRWTLTKLVLGSISLYYFSLFRAPKGVLKILESARNRFWGGGVGMEGVRKKGLVWVKWEKVLGNFNKVGLNIGNLQASNLGLLGKWWWSLSGKRVIVGKSD